jgi:hypothetical protein
MPRFIADNNMTSLESFHYREHFQNNAYNSFDETLLMDFLYENPMYGKVDDSFNSVFLRKQNLKLFHNSQRAKFAMNFVVDAFTGLRRHMAEASALGKIVVRRSFIGDFIPIKAYKSLDEIYKKHIETYIGTFSTGYLMSDPKLQSKVITFDDFFREFRKYLLKNALNYPLTKTNFIKSKHCPSGISGLILEISNQQESDDGAKVRNYINDPNFNFYINAARKFGFYVDKNCPWRLIADISSEAMFEYMKGYGLGSVKDLFSTYYTIAYRNDISSIKEHLLDMYNNFVDEFPHAQKNSLVGCSDSFSRPSERSQNLRATTSYTARTKISSEMYAKKYPDIYWLIFYAQLRFLESGYVPAPNSLQSFERDLVRRYRLKLSSTDNDFFLAFESVLRYIDAESMRVSALRHRRIKTGVELYLSEARDGRIIDTIRSQAVIPSHYIKQ